MDDSLVLFDHEKVKSVDTKVVCPEECSKFEFAMVYFNMVGFVNDPFVVMQKKY